MQSPLVRGPPPGVLILCSRARGGERQLKKEVQPGRERCTKGETLDNGPVPQLLEREGNVSACPLRQLYKYKFTICAANIDTGWGEKHHSESAGPGMELHLSSHYQVFRDEVRKAPRVRTICKGGFGQLSKILDSCNTVLGSNAGFFPFMHIF